MNTTFLKDTTKTYGDNLTPSFVVPDGYMTGDEFERRVITGLRNRLEKDGYFQRNSAK